MPIQVLWLPARAPQAAPVNGQLYRNRSDQTRNIILTPPLWGPAGSRTGASDEIPHPAACPLPLGNQEVSHFRTPGLSLGYQLQQF